MLPAIPPLSASGTTPVASANSINATPTVNDSFNSAITNAVDSLQASQSAASQAEAQAAAGEGNLADTMIAASKASLETQVTTDLLDKAVTSYNDIMNMSF